MKKIIDTLTKNQKTLLKTLNKNYCGLKYKRTLAKHEDLHLKSLKQCYKNYSDEKYKVFWLLCMKVDEMIKNKIHILDFGIQDYGTQFFDFYIIGEEKIKNELLHFTIKATRYNNYVSIY